MLAHKMIVLTFVTTGVMGLQDRLPSLTGSSYAYSPSVVQQITGYPPHIMQHKIRMMGVELRSHLGQFTYELSGELQHLGSSLRQTDLFRNLELDS